MNPNNNKPFDPPLKRLRVGDFAFVRVKVVDYSKNPLSFDDNPDVSEAIVVPVGRMGHPSGRYLYVAEEHIVTVDEARRAVGGAR